MASKPKCKFCNSSGTHYVAILNHTGGLETSVIMCWFCNRLLHTYFPDRVHDTRVQFKGERRKTKKLIKELEASLRREREDTILNGA